MELKEFESWYKDRRPSYEAFTEIVRGMVESLMRQKRIVFLSVTGRAKTVDSAVEKARSKSYQDASTETHDLSGIRIITFIESDVTKACEVVTSCFNVHPDESVNKSAQLGVDRIGYRSMHYVCDLGKNRLKLPEFAPYVDMVFEVQIRTTLQHAWAEIEHDRNYKFSRELPANLQRRLHLAAGLLEVADREFDWIAKEIEEYSKEVTRKAVRGDLQIGIDTVSLPAFLKAYLRSYLKSKVTHNQMLKIHLTNDASLLEMTVRELIDYGITSFEAFDKLVTAEFCRHFLESGVSVTESGFVRLVLMFADLERYLDKSWQKHWQALSPKMIALLSAKYGSRHLANILRQYKIDTNGSE